MPSHGRHFELISLSILILSAGAFAQTPGAGGPIDPGPRQGAAGAGGPAAGLGADYSNLFFAARGVFGEIDSVSGGIAGENGKGLGPTFNANSCAACHAQPDVGGSSPHPTLGIGAARVPNPQVSFASLDRLAGRNQVVPSFIRADGPVREARFIHNADGSNDGGVHALYTIAGRVDAPNCTAAQPDFVTALNNNNVIFRIPTPIFGAGLIENTSDNQLRAAFSATASARAAVGIAGRFNSSGNDGTITRFGWKAQNKSLLIFAGEAYNVEQGVTNEAFPNERGMADGCELNATPEDRTNLYGPNGGLTGTVTDLSSDVTNFAMFMRLSAPPTPTTSTTSEKNGAALFNSVGCNLCHTVSQVAEESPFPGRSNLTYKPYSDIAIHHMGPGLADFVSQGAAGPDEFRTAPLWGVGQRIFFLHDGRSGPANGGLIDAVRQHYSKDPSCAPGQQFNAAGVACASEANGVIAKAAALTTSQQQDILNFLRSL